MSDNPRLNGLVGAVPVAPPRTELTFTIPINTALSAGVALGNIVPISLWTPAAWTAAAVSFLASRDGGATFADMFDEAGSEIAIPSAAIPTAAARRFSLNPRLFLSITHLQIRSGLTGAGVNQSAARDLVLVGRPF